MSNYAALIGPLSICGSLKTDGTPNVNGIVWFYSPGTTTPVTVYADAAATVAVTAPVTLDVGGRVPYGTYPAGLYTKQPIRLLIQDSTGLTVSDTVFETGADSTGLNNAGFTGTTVDQAFTALYQSVGGPDGKYLAKAGGTALTIQSVLNSVQLTPQSFGAVGDGLHDDTNAIQAAINALVAMGGGRLFFPPGTYKISAALTVSGTAAVMFAGVTLGSSVIHQTAASTAVLSSTGPAALYLQTIGFTGGGLTTTGVTGGVTVDRCSIVPTSGYSLAVSSGGGVTVKDSLLNGVTGGMSLSSTGGTVSITGGALAGTNSILMLGTSGSLYANNVAFNGTKGVVWDATSTGTGVIVENSPTIASCSPPFDATAISADPGVVQRGNNFDNVTTTMSSLPANSGSPSSIANGITLNVTGGGAGAVTVPSPAPTPGANTQVGHLWEYRFINASGGAVSWTLNSMFRLNAVPPNTDGQTTAIGVYWDGTHLRERYRATSNN